MKSRTLLLVVALCCCAAAAQKTTSAPATDSAAQASPIQAPPKAPADDAAQQASPVSPMPTGGPALAPRTALPLKLSNSIDSGKLKNGQNVDAVLTVPVRSNGVSLSAGTPVQLTVVGTTPAGKISSAGEFSLQLVRVGKMDVFTEIQTFRGNQGHKDMPDSAPAPGSDAMLNAGAELTFHVQAPPQPATEPAGSKSATQGVVDGVANGSSPK